MAGSGGTTQFVWDTVTGANPLLLSAGPTNYVYGPNELPIEQTDSSGSSVSYLDHDQQGSTRLLTDSTGAVVGTYSYSPTGDTTSHSGSTTSLRYDGQYQDDESGLYDLRARFYDPTTGVFLTRDPLEEFTGQPYAYADDDPLDDADPSGLAVIGGCVSLSIDLIFSYTVQTCLVDDGSHLGATYTHGPGVGGFGASLGTNGLLSNAKNNKDLGGPFSQTGAGVGEVVQGTADVENGYTDCGDPITVFEPGASLSPPFSSVVDVHVRSTTTHVYNLPSFLNPLKALSI